MKTYNSPGQARSLREIEAAAMSPTTQIIKDIDGIIQPIPATVEKEEEETRSETKTEGTSKKARSKKKTEAV